MYRLKRHAKQCSQIRSPFPILPLLAALILAASTTSTGIAAPSKPATKTSKPGQLAPRLYDFKGVPLEISLEEFRRLPHPDGKTARVVCTGDNVLEDGRPSLLSGLAVSSSEAALGIKKCAWWGKAYSTLPEEAISLKLPAEGYGIGVYTFDFIPDPRDGKMRFYRFFGTSHSNANGEVVAALTEKFGPPKSKIENSQNGFGARFESTESMWANPLSILTVKERWNTITKMAIMLTDNRLLKIVIDDDKARKAQVKNAI